MRWALFLFLLGCQTSSPVGSDAGADALVQPSCTPTTPEQDDLKPQREACAFKAGDKPRVTLRARAKIPIEHVIVVMQENRSFDHMLGRLPQAGKADVDGWPSNYTNADTSGAPITPFHLSTACVPVDPPHGWDAMHASWNNGAMDGFVKIGAVKGSNGHDTIGHYDESDLPFYYWLAKTFAISDRYFSSVIGPTWPNRQYLYMASSYGNKETNGPPVTGKRTIFDALTQAGVSWKVYSNAIPRQDCIGWTLGSPGTAFYAQLAKDLEAGNLAQVVFVDPAGAAQDEHPVNSVYMGEQWGREVITNVMRSSLWPKVALFYTYDEGGGFADHVPPPKACLADPTQAEFDRMGFRVPLYVVSPWVRAGYVSHETHEHTSILRFIETVFDLGALTDRDANSSAMLDLFDFTCPARLVPPPAPEAHAGTIGCK